MAELPQDEAGSRGTLLIISQVYVPDSPSVGQHMHDAAVEMTRRGWDVVVYSSARGYEDTTQRFPKRELLDDVDIRRLPLSSFGKSSVPVRLLAGFIFLAQAIFRSLFVRDVRHILVSTSPPMCSIAGLILGKAKRAPISYWAMDINPDQMVALGQIGEHALPVRAFDWLNARILRHSRNIIALDRYMADRLNQKHSIAEKVSIIPPWPHMDQDVQPLRHEENPFRKKHRLTNQFVIMYSGNLSTSHPVDTILNAAKRLKDHDDILFLFIGGGNGRETVAQFIAENSASNIMMLPYQPLSELRFSLSAADVHLVAMGESMIGVVHPCKIYGAMAVGRPVILLGPEQCHAGDILAEHQIGWRIEHGDVEKAVEVIIEMASTSGGTLEELGNRAREISNSTFSKRRLLNDFCDVLEGVNK
jgi:colanic acid biosynthesis glycosyl transferase WcaI